MWLQQERKGEKERKTKRVKRWTDRGGERDIEEDILQAQSTMSGDLRA